MSKSSKPYSIGRIVMYVPEGSHTPEAHNSAKVLPAIIVRTWEETSYENDEVNLKVFTDGPTDTWRTSVPYSETKEPGTWHWPEIVSSVKTIDEAIKTTDGGNGGNHPPGSPGKP
jgi:hypothetical protein